MDIVTAFSLFGGSGIIAGIVLRRLDRLEKKMDKQEKSRVSESVVIIKGLQAIGHLSKATAIAQKRGHTNGETEEALKYYYASRDELNDYLTTGAAENAHSRA